MAQMDSDVCRLIEHIRLAGQRPTDRFDSKYKPRFVLGNRSIHPHLTERRVNCATENSIVEIRR